MSSDFEKIAVSWEFHGILDEYGEISLAKRKKNVNAC
jgi:hypothetical protein